MFARVLTFEFRPEPIVEAQMEKSRRGNIATLYEHKSFITLYNRLNHFTHKVGTRPCYVRLTIKKCVSSLQVLLPVPKLSGRC